MKIIISPAKTLNMEKTIPYDKHTIPLFLDETKELVKILKKKSPEELSKLMEISSSLAELNHARYQQWKAPFNTKNSRPCIFTFDGDVYQGFDFLGYNDKDYNNMEKILRIISGLHGILRPYDLIQPYRLDMHTPLKNSKGNNLYAFWKEKVTKVLKDECDDILVNCASKEYFETIDFSELKCKVITPHFKNIKNGKYIVIGMFAKKARGMFADFVIRNNIANIVDLKKFNKGGYVYDKDTSTDTDLVFLRKKQ